ncbi:unnamed protein product [Owenia fusiformis]|uniref:Uncharacterized protein n=1 Tax=Owenia fusiformis TaxID=6347 RepID=A0A8S4PDD0_OWEFU|nr:unnamed protein product [Owenia fusiformis]
MARRLLEIQRPNVFNPGKTDFHTDILIQPNQELIDFLGPRSWLLFDLTNGDTTWLNLPINQWATHQGYITLAAIVHNLHVVNDAAERSVKDIQDYANAARDGTVRARMILVSSSHRAKIPAFLKNEMQNNL